MAGSRARVTLEERLFRCWQRGDTIRETILSIKRTDGRTLEFERVRLVFVDLCDRFAGTAGIVE